jgi:hypothetical protein
VARRLGKPPQKKDQAAFKFDLPPKAESSAGPTGSMALESRPRFPKFFAARAKTRKRKAAANFFKRAAAGEAGDEEYLVCILNG